MVWPQTEAPRHLAAAAVPHLLGSSCGAPPRALRRSGGAGGAFVLWPPNEATRWLTIYVDGPDPNPNPHPHADPTPTPTPDLARAAVPDLEAHRYALELPKVVLPAGVVVLPVVPLDAHAGSGWSQGQG